MKKSLFLFTALLFVLGLSAQVQSGQVYIIKNKQSGLNATTGSTVMQTNGTGDNVKWEFIASGNNFHIKNKQSGLYLINSFGVASVKNTPELWAIETSTAGLVQLKHVSTGKYLKSNNQSPGAAGLLLADKLTTDFGKWTLELAQAPVQSVFIDEAVEYLVVNIGTGLKMTDSGSTSNIPQTTQTGNAARWKFVKSGNNWLIKNLGTGKFLAVSANVVIPVAQAQAQAWAAEAIPLAIGQARLKHVPTGKYLLAQASGAALLTGANTGQNTAKWDIQMQIPLPTNTGPVGYNVLNSDKIKLALLHNLGLPETIPMFDIVRRGVHQYLLNELGRLPSEVEIDNFLLTIENEAMMEDRVKIIIGLRKVITDLALKPAHQLTPLENQLLAHIAEKVRQHNMQFADRVIVEWNKFEALSNAGGHQYSFAPIFVLGAPDPNNFSMPSPYVLSPLQKQMLESYVAKAQESSNIAFAVTSYAIAVPGIAAAIAAGVLQGTAAATTATGVGITSLVGHSTMGVFGASASSGSSVAATVAAPAFVIIMAAVITGYGAYMITEGVKFEKLLNENKEKASKSVNLQNLVSTPEGFETLIVYLDYHLAVSVPILHNVNRQNGTVMEIVMP